MPPPCAICHNPSKRADEWRLGNQNTSRICPDCKGKPENDEWRVGSRLEAGGFDADTLPAGSAVNLGTRRDPFTGPVALKIMVLWCKSTTYRQIAAEVGCQLSYVIKTVGYWRRRRGEKLKLIMDIVRLKQNGVL